MNINRILITLLVLVTMVTGGWAKTVVNVTRQTATVIQYSTVYVGEVIVDGKPAFHYLYSDDISNGSTVLGSLWQSLKNFKGGVYSAMLTNYYDLPDENKGIALCSNSDYVSMMNADWTDASQAGLACLANTGVVSSSSNDLFQSDADFAARCTFEENADIVDNAGNNFVISGPLGKLSSTNTDNVTYSVDNGELVKHIDRQIDYTCESITVIYTKAELSSPLTFEAVEDGTISVSWNDGTTPSLDVIQYNLNNTGWTDVTWNTPIDLAANDVICFRGDNGTCHNESEWAGFHFECSEDCYVYGNVMSVIDKDGFATNTTLTKPYAFYQLFTRADGTPNSTILNHPTRDLVLPATTLTNTCYMDMFAGCQGLTRSPELPATTLTYACYKEMFKNCTGLTKAPALPATTLTPSCYYQMFYGCTGLTTAPELAATTLESECYCEMFSGCTGLTTAPALPATTLTLSCYWEMFGGCTGLTTAPELPATTLANYCYQWMFYNCTNLTTAPALPATTLAIGCYQGMFESCTRLENAPELPATTLAASSYSSMFYNCTSLNYVKCLATDISAEYCTSYWLYDVATTGTVVKAAEMNDWAVGPDANGDVNGIPTGWTVEDYFDPYATPLTLEAASDGEITFNYTLSLYHDAELTDIEYQMNGGAWTTYTWNDPIPVFTGDKVAFRGNNDSYFGNGKGYESRITSTADVYVYGNVMSLINPTEYPTLKTLTGKDAFSHLFAKAGTNAWEFVSNTTIQNHPTKDLVLPATTLTNMCYMDMFAGCEGLTRAPELPATEMTVSCYAEMFTGCTNLTKAPALPTTTFTPYGQDPVTFEEYGSIDCYMSMFSFCENLTEAPELPATTLVHGVLPEYVPGLYEPRKSSRTASSNRGR